MKSNYHNKHINTQSGNILIYILGAIILIGLLTIMVKGSSTPGAGIDRETLEIRVAEVQAYGNELERGVAYILRNGYSESDIRFAHPNHSSAYGDITDIPARQVFAREGGGVTWRDNDPDIQVIDTDWLFNGQNKVYEVGSSTCGATNLCTDLVAFLRNVTLDFCLLINDKNDITNPSNLPPVDDAFITFTTPFIGDFTLSTALYSIDNNLNGKKEGCFQENGLPGTYHYYRVLLAR